MSLTKPENRDRWKECEPVYLDEWPMSGQQKQTGPARDCNRLFDLAALI